MHGVNEWINELGLYVVFAVFSTMNLVMQQGFLQASRLFSSLSKSQIVATACRLLSVAERGLSRAMARLRERPFHYLGGGPGRLFQQIIFSVDVKAGFFFTHHLKPDFFSQELKVRLFFSIVMLGRQLFLPVCQSDRFFFFAQRIKAKKFFQYTGWAKLIFSAKSSARLFFKKSSRPPPIMKWSLPYSYSISL